MAKFPYLFRRNNIFYFRARIPIEHQKSFKAKEQARQHFSRNLKWVQLISGAKN